MTRCSYPLSLRQKGRWISLFSFVMLLILPLHFRCDSVFDRSLLCLFGTWGTRRCLDFYFSVDLSRAQRSGIDVILARYIHLEIGWIWVVCKGLLDVCF